eukprot:m.928973 g.928973  ORF g.928973 m.928973 type:complete len:53 (+) comp23780_c0_seq21:1270-1428(+)
MAMNIRVSVLASSSESGYEPFSSRVTYASDYPYLELFDREVFGSDNATIAEL